MKSINDLLNTKVKDKNTGEIFTLTGFLSNSGGVVHQLGLKDKMGMYCGFSRKNNNSFFEQLELIENDKE